MLPYVISFDLHDNHHYFTSEETEACKNVHTMSKITQ